MCGDIPKRVVCRDYCIKSEVRCAGIIEGRVDVVGKNFIEESVVVEIDCLSEDGEPVANLELLSGGGAGGVDCREREAGEEGREDKG